MYLTPEQYIAVFAEIDDLYRRMGVTPSPAARQRHLLLLYPNFEGVRGSLLFSHVEEAYLPHEWRVTRVTPPARARIRPLTDHDLRPLPPPRTPFPNSPRLVAGSPRDALAPFAPPPDPAAQILADLSLLAGNPVAAATYLNFRGLRGYDQDTAMRRARGAGDLWRMLLNTPQGIQARSAAERARGDAEWARLQQQLPQQLRQPRSRPPDPVSAEQTRTGLLRLQ